MNHKNLSFGAVCRHMTVSLGIIDFTAFLRMINNLVIIIITILICSKQIQFFAAPPAMMAFPQSLQLLLNIPSSTPSLSQWLAIIWMSHSIWNWDTWMNIIGYFPIDPFGFKTPPWLPPAPQRMYLWGGVSLPRCYWPQDLRAGTEHACVFGRLIFNGTSGPFKTWGQDRGDRAD